VRLWIAAGGVVKMFQPVLINLLPFCNIQPLEKPRSLACLKIDSNAYLLLVRKIDHFPNCQFRAGTTQRSRYLGSYNQLATTRNSVPIWVRIGREPDGMGNLCRGKWNFTLVQSLGQDRREGVFVSKVVEFHVGYIIPDGFVGRRVFQAFFPVRAAIFDVSTMPSDGSAARTVSAT